MAARKITSYFSADGVLPKKKKQASIISFAEPIDPDEITITTEINRPAKSSTTVKNPVGRP